jgi:hypothetical protein
MQLHSNGKTDITKAYLTGNTCGYYALAPFAGKKYKQTTIKEAVAFVFV